ncbi:Putative ABC transporter ATP-binding subunit protein [Salinisphaera shabanensis E1L3A]|jgi:ABC-2 type transport system ATP-binding protein|uniref:ABC transporter ATP-binding subunit protein n=1 Tax=Salinisphaera shabanensis E1L3A TaxID=1033802 RepID=U2EAD5_9GAMM|nr:ABC transporter ATP-binding protein [Salinisphaera shabanensis]ERJ20611.1 Putative ABC transporter ATP-binding subunit protein [Salinisphaera shabanensis E1L3A]
MTEPAISIQNVEKRYPSTHALKGVSFDIRPGEYFGLLGPNGAGKSTLISIIAGLTHATSGNVAVLGHDVRRDFRQSRRALGVVPQELVYDPFFPVREMLRIQAGYFGCGKDYWPWIDELLERLDLTDKAEVSMRALSGGMKRRVLIAQALVHKPDVVILDEPTAGVDVELRRTLWKFTRELNEAGHTIVLTTHYLEEAEELCDRIAILDRGQLSVLEDKRALLDRHPYRFLSLQLSGNGGALPASVERLIEDRHGDTLELKLEQGKDFIADVMEAIRDAGYRIQDVRTREPSLENIFVELTDHSHDTDEDAA